MCYSDQLRTERDARTRHVGARDRVLRGKVGQIRAQCLAGDEVRRIVVQEMHTADDRVCLGNQLMARWRRDGLA